MKCIYPVDYTFFCAFQQALVSLCRKTCHIGLKVALDALLEPLVRH